MIIRSEEIYKKANSIVKSCGTRDTLKIARELGIHLHFLDNLNDLLGMYTYRHKERHILLNSNMEYLIMQMVCGHEIGHDTFHRDLAKGNEPLPEFVLFDMRTKHEYASASTTCWTSSNRTTRPISSWPTTGSPGWWSPISTT